MSQKSDLKDLINDIEENLKNYDTVNYQELESQAQEVSSFYKIHETKLIIEEVGKIYNRYKSDLEKLKKISQAVYDNLEE